ncbi:MAG: aminopeptidase, partial [Mycoplasmatales bacterium]
MNENMKKYARLLVRKGLNVQPGQPVRISAPIECIEFVRLVVDEIYEVSQKGIIIDWTDDYITRSTFINEPIENFENTPEFLVKKSDYTIDNNFALLKISATDPDNLNGVDPVKIMTAQKTMSRDLKRQTHATMSDNLSWTVASIPTSKWAKKVFPNSDTPIDDLWEAIIKATRSDTIDPVLAWEEHVLKLTGYAKNLNNHKFEYLVFTNSIGTNIEVGLPKGHIWMAAESLNNVLKNTFIANMPTEEVFTMPHKDKVNGKVYASKPLNYQGALIEDFWIEFKDGKVVDLDAKKNKETLEKLVKVDEGACMLGEVALVSYNTPISMSNVLFYNTLFDENASCHLALGKAYPTCIKDS